MSNSLPDEPKDPLVRLQPCIQKLVQRFQQDAQALEPVSREILRLALDYELSPESLRRRLRQARLAGSRASELKLVYETDAARNAFLETPPKSWRKTLQLARKLAREAERAEQQLTRADWLRAQIAGLLHREQNYAVTLDGMELSVSYNYEPVLAQLHLE